MFQHTFQFTGINRWIAFPYIALPGIPRLSIFLSDLMLYCSFASELSFSFDTCILMIAQFSSPEFIQSFAGYFVKNKLFYTLHSDFSKLSVYSISPPTILNRFYFQLSVPDFISETFCHCTDQTRYHEISFVCVPKQSFHSLQTH